jgi:hypothetical protein
MFSCGYILTLLSNLYTLYVSSCLRHMQMLWIQDPCMEITADVAARLGLCVWESIRLLKFEGMGWIRRKTWLFCIESSVNTAFTSVVLMIPTSLQFYRCGLKIALRTSDSEFPVMQTSVSYSIFTVETFFFLTKSLKPPYKCNYYTKK